MKLVTDATIEFFT